MGFDNARKHYYSWLTKTQSQLLIINQKWWITKIAIVLQQRILDRHQNWKTMHNNKNQYTQMETAPDANNATEVLYF